MTVQPAAQKGPVTEWHPYRDKWFPREMECSWCGAVKPAGASSEGWWKRWRSKENRTERRCPSCGRGEGRHGS